VSHRDETPKWREDFPYDAGEDEAVTRRDLTRFLLVAGTGLAAGSGWVWARSRMRGERAWPAVDVCGEGEIAPGASRGFEFAGEPALLVRRPAGELVAFQRKCTHLACPVTYRPAGDEGGEALVCHCHHGRFDVGTGRGLAGPPRSLRPLRRIQLERRDGRIVAIGLVPRGEVVG
jgi:nitrite reductase/ring-hydroxylating ferredoxin subunit